MCGLGLDISFMCGKVQLGPKVALFANIGKSRWWWNWYLIKVCWLMSGAVCFSNVLKLQIKSGSIKKIPENVSLLIFNNWVPSTRNLLWAVSGERECGRRGRRPSVDRNFQVQSRWEIKVQSRWEIKVQSRWAFYFRVLSRIYLNEEMVCAFERKFGLLGGQGTLQNTAFRI